MNDHHRAVQSLASHAAELRLQVIDSLLTLRKVSPEVFELSIASLQKKDSTLAAVVWAKVFESEESNA